MSNHAAAYRLDEVTDANDLESLWLANQEDALTILAQTRKAAISTHNELAAMLNGFVLVDQDRVVAQAGYGETVSAGTLPPCQKNSSFSDIPTYNRYSVANFHNFLKRN